MQLMEKFRKPENFDKVDEGTGWIMYAGGNDWENGITAVAVVFPSDEENYRLWMKLKFPKDCVPNSSDSGGSSDENRKKCRDYGQKAWRAWKRNAVSRHRNKNHGSRSWVAAFKAALHDMGDYYDEWGEDRTKWQEESKAQAIVTKLLDR
jgi:hypothetical protein